MGKLRNWQVIIVFLKSFDSNYHNSFKRGVEAYVTAEANLAGATIQSVNSLREAKLSVQADKDKQFFFEDNQGTVVQPFKFAYLPYTDEEVGIFTQLA